MIPLLITARRNVTLDGTNPTILHAYGGELQNSMHSLTLLLPSVSLLDYSGVDATLAESLNCGQHDQTQQSCAVGCLRLAITCKNES